MGEKLILQSQDYYAKCTRFRENYYVLLEQMYSF